MNEYKYKVAWCKICNQGWIIVVKDIQTLTLHLCCDECETEWESPYELRQGNCLPYNTYGRYDIPTEEEIINKGWLDEIIK